MRIPTMGMIQSRWWTWASTSAKLMATAGRLTSESAMDLLSDVAQSSTQWSVVYDMARLQVHVAMGRDHEGVHVMGGGE